MQDANRINSQDQEGTPHKDNKTQDFSTSHMTEQNNNAEPTVTAKEELKTERMLELAKTVIGNDIISVADKLNDARVDGIRNGSTNHKGEHIAGVGTVADQIVSGLNGNRFSKADTGTDTSLGEFSDTSEKNKAALRAGNLARKKVAKKISVSAVLIAEACRVRQAEKDGARFELKNATFNADNGGVGLSYGEKTLTKKEQAEKIRKLERELFASRAKVAQLELPIPSEE
ncbi:MAG: hypothetical protein Unbinned3806contig1000_80 [Prokaryotic dsDNA virus sp.]|nr:MAG: hypothetical protein Unbinned3806contig1000_80 [Prokaryotic dsDNA virus sp.]|tara:strand:+ start:3469 stop:4158 length:690 start_codon:yes stop_codon:yes gene_type:complete